ncbi:Putative ribonuclease H protein At1g65750 [Linum perenne]
MFADDTYMFLKVSDNEILNLLDLFELYQLYSGQKINLSKSVVTFSKGTSEVNKLLWSYKLGATISNNQDIYLGLPSMMKRSKIQTFRFLEDILRKKINSWKGKWLSPAGMEVLISSVLSAMPTYAMASFQIPKTNINSLNQLIADFWWGQVDDKKKMHWVSWEKLCRPKDEGGLGFRDFETFNRALLAKQAWRILQEPNLLISQILKAKYFPDTSMLDAETCPGASWGWRGLLVGRDVLKSGYRWQVGSGLRIDPLRDQWVPTKPPSTPLLNLRHFGVEIPGSVADLISEHKWDTVKLRNIFYDDTVNSILSLPIPICEMEDKIIWQPSSSGEYTVQSGYEIARQIILGPKSFEPTSVVDKKLWEGSWNLQIQPKFRFFIWKLLRGIIPVKGELIKRKIQLSPECPVCGMEDESIEHLFLRCILVSKVATLCNLPMTSFNAPSFVYTWREIMNNSPSLATSFVIFWWRIWKSRNTVVFQFKQYLPEILHG